jgi:hypothetical protein
MNGHIDINLNKNSISYFQFLISMFTVEKSSFIIFQRLVAFQNSFLCFLTGKF